MALVYIGLGSNQADPQAQLAGAIRMLGALPNTEIVETSGLYRTAAVGYEDQPDFLNQVAALETALPPRELLAELQAIERVAGRERTVRWGPRTLDLDILWYDGRVIHEADLEVPHPRMGERRFVLAPLAELAPHLALPGGRRVDEALPDVQDQRVARLEDPEEEGER